MSTDERKYELLLNILDRTIQDGVVSGRRSLYRKANESQDDRDQARARAFIHLYLEARCGLYDFDERENQITDSSCDGGIDAFYIDEQSKMVILVQAKFRTNPQNFSQKAIGIEEITKIEADRIVHGETTDVAGNEYSGHILKIQRSINNIKDVARYSYKVVLLANVRQSEKLAVSKILTDYETEIYDFRRCYDELVLPILRGEQTYFQDLRFNLDMSNKSSGSRLSAKIKTEHGSVDVTVVLAPTIEIAKLMSRYRNSILRYNPRSYLEFIGQNTNKGIRESITNRDTGEFALLNNGITFLSDQTYVSEKIGKKDLAQIEIHNPQIINGGQTAFTLSRIYDERSDEEREATFSDKEVVVRVITLPELEEKERMRLIREISAATNSQTQVSAADRLVTTDEQREIAQKVFEELGILYEHKRGEYSDAVQKGYISRTQVIERSLFIRLTYLASGEFRKAVRAKATSRGQAFQDMTLASINITALGDVWDFYRLVVGKKVEFSSAKIAETLAMIQLSRLVRQKELLQDTTAVAVAQAAAQIWRFVAEWATGQMPKRFITSPGTKEATLARQTTQKWIRSAHCQEDMEAYLDEFGLAAPPSRQPNTALATALEPLAQPNPA